MKHNIIELTRHILLKTLVPLQIKWQRYVSQFHFSIAFRIAFNYVRLFVLYGAFFFALVIAVYVRVEYNEYTSYAQERMALLKEGKIELQDFNYFKEHGIAIYYYDDETNYNSYHQELDADKLLEIKDRLYREHVNPNYENGMSMRIMDITNNSIVYDDVKMDVSEDFGFIDKYSYNYNGNNLLIVKESFKFEQEGTTYEAYFQYDITNSIKRLQEFIGMLLIIYIIFVLFVAKFGKTGIERLFQPINEMSATASKLTAANLHSQRLNVVGTKNELKDLAATINTMLDRIECSYESQRQFVSDASHELRTPIAVIQGYANMLERWGSKEEDILEESIDAIIKESKSMQDLVEKLLFLSRHDKKTLKLSKTRFNMRTVVEDMIKETKLVVRDRNIINLILEDAYVYGDQQALKQVIRIFVDNAVKYSREGDSICINCYSENKNCVIVVEDTGIGMKKEDMDRIFERFYRSDEVRDNKINGHGLGLSIAKLIILKHTGIIKVRSQYTKGSRFTILIPQH